MTFPDAEAAVVAYLRDAFDDHVAVWVPEDASVSVRAAQSSLSGDATAVQVELESGNVVDFPVTERAQVRVTCYAGAGKRSNVKALASLALGLLARMHTADVAGVVPMIGRSDVVEDPDTGNLMCWVLVRVDLKATQLAS